MDTAMIHTNIYTYSELHDLDIKFTATQNIDCIDLHIEGSNKFIVVYEDNEIEVQQPKKKSTYIWTVKNIFAALDIAMTDGTPKGYSILR